MAPVAAAVTRVLVTGFGVRVTFFFAFCSVRFDLGFRV